MTKHINSQFDEDLTQVSSHVLELGGVVEKQISLAISSLVNYDRRNALQVLEEEVRVNQYEIDIDLELAQLIAKRQPNATDLRLILGIGKTVANLERAGDEASRIARMVMSMHEKDALRRIPVSDLKHASDLALSLLKRSLDSLARLDAVEAFKIMKEDNQIDEEFGNFMRKIVTFIMEDPRNITACLDLVFVAKAIERIGDHAKNISEIVIYIAKGADVRHTPYDVIESTLS